MTCIAVRCPHWPREQSIKRGTTARGTQRSLCQTTLGAKGSFLRDSCHRGGLPAVQQTLIAMRLHARGVRATARSLPLGPHTVLRELRQHATVLKSVHTAVLRTLTPAEVAWDLERAGAAEAEREELWSLVGHQGNPRWRWHASDHHTGKVVADGFGRRTDAGFVQFKTRRAPCGLTRYSPDHGGASTRHVAPDVHRPGTRHTQQIERKPLT